MTVVSDASPLIALAAIGQLNLLRALYGTVIVPGTVFDEAALKAADAPGAQEIRSAQWIKTERLQDIALVQALRLELGPGESEAIACAAQQRADWLLIDERRGRMAAEKLGLRVLGTLGVLIAAKHAGALPAVGPALDALRGRGGFWIDDVLLRRVLQAAGEG